MAANDGTSFLDKICELTQIGSNKNSRIFNFIIAFIKFCLGKCNNHFIKVEIYFSSVIKND